MTSFTTKKMLFATNCLSLHYCWQKIYKVFLFCADADIKPKRQYLIASLNILCSRLADMTIKSNFTVHNFIVSRINLINAAFLHCIPSRCSLSGACWECWDGQTDQKSRVPQLLDGLTSNVCWLACGPVWSKWCLTNIATTCLHDMCIYLIKQGTLWILQICH